LNSTYIHLYNKPYAAEWLRNIYFVMDVCNASGKIWFWGL